MAVQNFEKALADLEMIVGKLEKGDLPLNESLALFEKGIKLARFLRQELGRAEKKVEILLKDEEGRLKTEAFELEDENEEAEGEEEEEEDDKKSGGGGKLPF
ncbi:MAG: exodeoxyribonuclease VII small subunit [Candidatus Aminicenantes bacterium RBG_13_62_12]|nr:MAG: exodeoxyribonuclease VII small subunit [Candidatus Aminicenantes bacterium RBG_13_62_12]